MKITLICITIVTLFSEIMCYSYISNPPFENYERIADAITDNTAKKLKNDKGLVLIGTGGRMMDDIKMMMMDFEFFEVVDIKTARKLLIHCVEEYLITINSSKEIRPFLHNYPFTAKNIEIGIYFREPNRSKVPPGKIKIVSSDQGKIHYYENNPKEYALKAIHEETYEEALQALSSNK